MRSKLLVLAVAPILGGSMANAALLVHYSFDRESARNNGIGPDGTEVGGGTYVPSTAGSLAGSAWQGNRTGANDALINTGLTGNDLGMGAGGVYTAMAWINWAGPSGGVDHMVFGAPGNGNFAQLHHGVRAGDANNIHYGGWGGDQDIADAGVIPDGGGSSNYDNWVHVAWQYDGTDNVVFVNGIESKREAGNNQTDPSLDVAIGFTARVGHGSFNGQLDEVRIYDQALTASEILAVSSVVGSPIPEPATTGLIALATLGLVRRRR